MPVNGNSLIDPSGGNVCPQEGHFVSPVPNLPPEIHIDNRASPHVEALFASQERFRLLVESVTDYAIYMLDPQGRVATWNIGAERSKGYKAEEILGRSYSVFFLPQDAEADLPQQELNAAVRDGRYQTEAWRQRKDGSRFWAMVTLTAIHDPNGELRGFAKVTRDMSERKAAEEALRTRNAQLEHYRLIVESIDEYSIYSLDPQGRLTSWEAGAQKQSGTPPEVMIGRPYSGFFPPEDQLAGMPEHHLAEAARTGRYLSDSWMITPKGERVWSSGVLNAVRDEVGKLTGYLCVARVTTRQKQAEEELKRLNAQLERYRIIVESVGDYAIYTLDSQGKIDSWSHGAEYMSGHTAEEAIGQDYSMGFSTEEIAAGLPWRELEMAACDGRCATDSWRRRKDGTLHWSSGVLTAVRDETGKLTGYIRVARDMTRQKQLEEAQKQMAAELEIRVTERTRELEETVAELQRKNQEVEAFVYIVSHDLRAPLVNVQGFARELEESCKHLRLAIQSCPQWERCWPDVQPILDEEIGGALHYISASSTKFQRLIDALLGFSRLGRQVYQMARVNVWELVTSAVATFQQLIAEAGASVEIGSLPSVIADSTALSQVFSNLIGNSLKYRSRERPLKIEVGGQIEDSMVHYWVRDNGLGIPDSGKSRLFQVFQRLHRDQIEGEGMGLAIVHRIVERHGGKIWVESREGEGATFHFSLPCTPIVEQKAAAQQNDH